MPDNRIKRLRDPANEDFAQDRLKVCHRCEYFIPGDPARCQRATDERTINDLVNDRAETCPIRKW